MKVSKALVIICISIILGYVSIVSMEPWGTVGTFATLCGLYVYLVIDAAQDLKKERIKELRHMREELKKARRAAENRQAIMNSFINNVHVKECTNEKRVLYNRDDFIVEL